MKKAIFTCIEKWMENRPFRAQEREEENIVSRYDDSIYPISHPLFMQKMFYSFYLLKKYYV